MTTIEERYQRFIEHFQKYPGNDEEHHIVPKCLGGGDEKSNLVKLPYRAHFIAHLMLHKIYPESKGLLSAAFLMSCKGKYTSRKYEELKRRFIAANSGENNFFYKCAPWETPNVRCSDKRRSVWAQADLVNQVWEKYGRPNGQTLARAFPDLRRGSFVRMIIMFNNGWVPEDDPKWLVLQSSFASFFPLEPKPYLITDKLWNSKSVNKSVLKKRVWFSADVIYANFDKLGFSYKRLGKKFNVPSGCLQAMCSYFIMGWSPRDDPDWVEFETALKHVGVQKI